MKFLRRSKPLDEIEIHLTDTEAARLIDELVSLRNDIADVGMAETHGWLVSDAEIAEARVYVYDTADGLEAEVADRLREPD